MCLTIECLLKECKVPIPIAFFLRTVIVNRGNSCELKPKNKKTFLSCVNEQIYSSFRKLSKRTNLE